MSQYDIVVLGGGPGGYAAAIRAAQLGAKVVLIEKDQVGGTCLNRGCIPTKAIIASTNLYEKIRKAESFGIKTENTAIDFKQVIERKNKVVGKVTRGVAFLLEKNGVEVIYGLGRAIEPGKVEVIRSDGCKLSVVSSKLILATGSTPISLPGMEFDGKRFLSSDDLLEFRPVPDKLMIVGGGVIGIHFAMIYSALGTQVTICEALPEVLHGMDEEIIEMVKRILQRRKINLLTGTRFDEKLAGDLNLICVGRAPCTAGLEALGLAMDRRSVKVNERLETSLPGVFAAGDLVSSKMLAHVAYEQGVIAAENAMGKNKTFNYDCVPVGIYTQPEIGAVGLTEKEASEKYGSVKTGKFPYSALGIATALGETEGFIKLIAGPENKLVGAHIIGAEATTLVGSATIAIKNGLSIEQLAETFQAHPSYPEGFQEAAENLLGHSLHIINQ